MPEEKDDVRKLIRDSHCYGSPRYWYETRNFIASLVSGTGSILDCGCANGYFLAELQKWTSLPLVLHGFDVDRYSIESAKNMHPQFAANFKVLSLQTFLDQEAARCQKFNYIYCSISHAPLTVKRLFQRVIRGGRLILGVYPNGCGVWSEEKSSKYLAQFQKCLNQLLDNNVYWSGIVENPYGHPHRLVYFDVR